ncbi:MAG TPA: peptidoglycan DD-metalloendopeptidase family protein [Candidatus Dormibacteraeota bacterium]|nr:peptidoglycan DD-metalloendopeptidase family protein [Candidatus Dormibacteraeota bacterium]
MFQRIPLAGGLTLLVICLAPTPVAGGDCAPNDTVCQQLQNAKQNQADTGRRLQDIQQSLADAQQKASQTLAYINELKAQIAAQQAKIAQTQAKLRETERQIRLTEAEIARREAHLQVRQGLLAQRVRAMDKHGSVDYMELVVTSRSFTEMVDRLVIMQDIIRSDQRLVDNLRQERDQIKQLRQKLQGEHDQQAALLKQQQDEEAQVERTKAAQQQALDYYHQLEAQLEGQRKELEAEKARIDALVSQLQAQFDAQARNVGGGTGRFGWPERGPITQPFGCTDLLGEPYDPSCPTRHIHEGIDIGASYGTSIGAADAGIVSLVTWNPCCGYGNYVLITHGNGYTTIYAHLSAIYVSVGQAVRRGQPIGAEGSTGYSTGPHLHFGVDYNGAWQNPLSYLS